MHMHILFGLRFGHGKTEVGTGQQLEVFEVLESERRFAGNTGACSFHLILSHLTGPIRNVRERRYGCRQTRSEKRLESFP